MQDLKRSTSSQYNDVQTQQAAGVKVSIDNGRPTISSADGKFTAAFRALGQFDWGYFSQGGNASSLPLAYGPDLSSGANFRRVYLGLQGKVFGDWSYNVNFDFGGSGGTEDQGRVQSLYVEYDGLAPFAVRIGAFPPSASLEDATSAGDTIFLERNSPADAARNIAGGDGRDAIDLLYTGDKFFASLAYTGGKVKDALGTYDEQTAAVARVSYLLYSDSDAKFLLTANGTDVFKVADTAPGANVKRNFSISDVPELTVDSSGYYTLANSTSVPSITSSMKLVNTGNIDTSGVLQWGGEAAAQWKSVYAQGGYFNYQIDRRASTLPDPHFGGWYAQASWVLTGESRGYNKSTAAFTAPKPDAPLTLDGSGWGAWELAARYSDLNLNFNEGIAGASTPSGGVRGGEQRIWTAGLNWYPNSVIRFDFDYEHIDIDRIIGSATASGVYPVISPSQANQSANQTINAVAVRAQISL